MSAVTTTSQGLSFGSLFGQPADQSPMSVILNDVLPRADRSPNDSRITKMPTILSESEIRRIDTAVSRVKAPLGEAVDLYDSLTEPGSFMSRYGKQPDVNDVAMRVLVLRETSKVLGDTELSFIKSVIGNSTWSTYPDPVTQALDAMNGAGNPSRISNITEVVSDLSTKAPKLAEMIICSAIRERGWTKSDLESMEFKCNMARMMLSRSVIDTIYLDLRETVDCSTRSGLYDLLPKKGQPGHQELCATVVKDLHSKNTQKVAEAALTLSFLGCAPETIKKVNGALRLQKMKLKNVLHPKEATKDGSIQTLKFAQLRLENCNGEGFEGNFNTFIEGLNTSISSLNGIYRRSGGF